MDYLSAQWSDEISGELVEVYRSTETNFVTRVLVNGTEVPAEVAVGYIGG